MMCRLVHQSPMVGPGSFLRSCLVPVVVTKSMPLLVSSGYM